LIQRIGATTPGEINDEDVTQLAKAGTEIGKQAIWPCTVKW
jgi:hypothetical protein